MAEDSFQDKTEDATPKRLEKAREEGNVAKSVEFNSVVMLFAGLMSLSFMGTHIFSKLVSGFRIFYNEAGSMSLTLDSINYYIHLGVKSFLSLVGPFAGVMLLVGLAANISQVGFMFSPKALAPKFSKVNPIKGMKKLVSPKSLVELVKGIVKLSIIGTIAYSTLMGHQDEYLRLMNESVGGILSFIADVMFQVAIRTTMALLLLAIIDMIYQRWQYKRDMRMSKQEVKDEHKQAEGDPLVKGAIRSMQQQRARERMMDKVPEADVIITNPTRLAIALKYDPDELGAPVVLAKGARLIAKKIREVAEKHNIPIYENKPLARSLYKLGEVGKEIPAELFRAVAEVFAFVFQMKNRRN